MNKSLIAALMSALVFPGSGHLYLRRFKSGIALMGISFIALAVLLNYIITQVRVVMDEIIGGSIPLGYSSSYALMAERVRTIIVASDLTSVRAATMVLAICWVAGIVDAYLTPVHDAHP